MVSLPAEINCLNKTKTTYSVVFFDVAREIERIILFLSDLGTGVSPECSKGCISEYLIVFSSLSTRKPSLPEGAICNYCPSAVNVSPTYILIGEQVQCGCNQLLKCV